MTPEEREEFLRKRLAAVEQMMAGMDPAVAGALQQQVRNLLSGGGAGEQLLGMVGGMQELVGAMAGAAAGTTTGDKYLTYRGDLKAAVRLLSRSILALQYVTQQLDMLEQMAPWEYHVVRQVLGHGSGFDSPGFRRVRDVTPALGAAFKAALGRVGLDLVALHRSGREHEELFTLEGQLSPSERVRLAEVADRCPVSQTLQRSSEVSSILVESETAAAPEAGAPLPG